MAFCLHAKISNHCTVFDILENTLNNCFLLYGLSVFCLFLFFFFQIKDPFAINKLPINFLLTNQCILLPSYLPS